MAFLFLLGFCVLCGSTAAAGLHPNAHPLLMVALEGETVTLPCGTFPIQSCSSVVWNMEESPEPGTAQQMTRDCSLQIHNLQLNDAQIYTCDNGTLKSRVSLKILQVTNTHPREGTLELHCFLNRYSGYEPCNNSTGVHMRWSSEDGSPLKGDRFKFENPSDCFSILKVTTKPTDHHRKWKCHITHNDVLKVISFTTIVKDGLEEVFASVGLPLSLPCRTSSLNEEGSVKWAMCERPLTGHHPGQTRSSDIMKDSSLVINKVQGFHAGHYQCSESSGQGSVLNKIVLHTLDVIAASGPGDNLTLICVLTCAAQCEKDFNITWSERNHGSQQSELMTVNNTIVRELFLSGGSVRDEKICSAHREGEVMASKQWKDVHSLPTPALFLLPLGLLLCAAAGGIYIYMKKRHKKGAAKEPSRIGMTQLYDVIQDINQEEQQHPRQRGEAVQASDDFYDLLQPVN